ncbi:MAG: hypothetical protein LBI19_09775 [Oscillospiraceae bacterium]|nr:hypothetical protein [Oscillospiraceae bacterium]
MRELIPLGRFWEIIATVLSVLNPSPVTFLIVELLLLTILYLIIMRYARGEMMTIFWERFNALSTEKDGSPNKTAKILKISSGSVTAWSRGTLPVVKTIKKIADYFEVSTAYLLGENTTAPGEERSAKEVSELLSDVQDLSGDEAGRVQEFVRFVKSQRTPPL